MAKEARLQYVTFLRRPSKSLENIYRKGRISSLKAENLIFTDYGDRFNRKEIYRLVIYYKEKAVIKKPGGAHVLFRHSPASLMVQNGCDLLTIQQVMRHNHIQTTMRYLHLADDTKRYNYDRFLKL